MNFSSAQKCLATIRSGDSVEFIRGNNRTKVLNAANCLPPLDQKTADDLGIKINVNFGELLVLLSHARSQLVSAFLQNQFFFTVKLPVAPAEKQSDWEAFITKEINRPMRESLEYFEVQRSKWSSVVTHGVGPQDWPKDDHWCPRFIAMSDLRIPTDTTLDFKNLNWYAKRVNYTPIELIDEVFNDKPNNKWDKKAVANILKQYKELNVTDATNNYDWNTSPEKLAELLKQNGGFYGSDAVPTIPLYHFYFEDTKKPGGWFMRVVADTAAVKGSDDNDFLFQSDEPIAKTWQELLHCQFGDLSTDAPFKYHSIRGLGYILLEPTFYTNLTRCRMLQHLNDQFNVWLRQIDTPDKARKQIQEFGNYQVIGNGISIIPQTERHQVEGGLIEMAFAQLKQLASEASSSYTQQADTGTQKEQTAFETRVKIEQVNAMMSGILLVAFKYASYEYREIARRFCLKNSTDPDINKFQRRCKQYGIPPEWLDVDHWEVEPVTPLGMGNPTIAQAAAQQLMALRQGLPPMAQNEIMHENILTITKDPRKAARWAPLDGKPEQSDASREAVGLFATLLTGVPIPLWPRHLIDQINAILPLLAGKITIYTQRDNMANNEEASGLQNVLMYLEQAVQSLGQDEQQAQLVKQYSDSLGKLGNEIKGLAQRGLQHAEAQKQAGINAQNGEAQAELNGKLQAMQVQAEAKARDKDATTAQSIHHKEIAFRSDESRKNKAAQEEQKRKDAAAFNELENSRIKTEAEVEAARKKAAAEPKPEPVSA